MASQLLCTVKFGVLAAIAFVGPKVITDIGNYLGRMEKRIDTPSISDIPFSELIHPSGTAPRGIEKPPAASDFGDRYAARYAAAPTDEPSPPLSPPKEMLSESAATPVTPMDRIFRFDLLPEAIVAAWPKVYADDSAPPLRGYRTAILTGTAPDDLTGSITWWFDVRQMCRIVLSGQIDDSKKLVDFMEYRYGMTLDEESTPTEIRYRSTSETRRRTAEISRMTLRPAAVFGGDGPKRNFSVQIELYRP